MNLDTLQERAKDVRLRIHQPDDDAPRCIGNSGPLIEWYLHKPAILRAILKHPERNLGTSYVRGDWDTDARLLPQLIQTLLSRSVVARDLAGRRLVQRLLARLPRRRRPDRPPHWYDISAAVSAACLGDDRLYACAWFSEAGMPLEQAQRIQRRRLLAKLQLRAGQHVLDLNAGWGSLALYLAQQMDIRVTAIVHSAVQLQFAKNQARRRALQGRVHFRQGGIDQCRGRFDRILADGLFEQHGEPEYPRILQRLEALLQQDGMASIQVSACNQRGNLSHHWLQQQLLYRRSLPLLSGILGALDTTRLRTLHIEDRSAHWQQTLHIQGQRYARQRPAICQRFGETLTRHWEFMLAAQETAAHLGQLNRYDLLLGNTRTLRPSERVPLAMSDRLSPDICQALTGHAPQN